jgi:hypothetical protein
MAFLHFRIAGFSRDDLLVSAQLFEAGVWTWHLIDSTFSFSVIACCAFYSLLYLIV